MKYLCLCYYDTEAFANLSPEKAQEIGPACRPHDAILMATGKLLVNASLANPETWSYFVPRNGKPHRVQGPYTQSKDQVGAFFILKADTEEEAWEVASKHAAANNGEHLGFSVELRACTSYDT